MERKIAIQGHGASSRRPEFGANWCFSLLTTPIRTCAAVALTWNNVAMLVHADCSTDVLATARELQGQVGQDRLQLEYICHERCSDYWTRKIGKPPTETITQFTGCCVQLRSNESACRDPPYGFSAAELHPSQDYEFTIAEPNPDLISHYHLDQKDLQAIKDLHILYCSVTVTTHSIRMGPVLLDTYMDLNKVFNAAQRKFSGLCLLTNGSIDWTKCIRHLLHVLVGDFLLQAVNPQRDIQRSISKDLLGMSLLQACESNALVKAECQFYLRKVKRYYDTLKAINFNDVTRLGYPQLIQYHF